MHALLISLWELVPGDVCTSHRAEPTRKGASLSIRFPPIPSAGSAPDCAFLAFSQRAMPMLREAHSPVSHTASCGGVPRPHLQTLEPQDSSGDSIAGELRLKLECPDIILWALEEPTLRASKMHHRAESRNIPSCPDRLARTGLPGLGVDVGFHIYLGARSILPLFKSQ